MTVQGLIKQVEEIGTFKKVGTFNKSDVDSMEYAGLYFLMFEGEVVYIGMTTASVAQRIINPFDYCGHINNKIFDSVMIFEVNYENRNSSYLLEEEAKLIIKYNPYYNIVGNKGKLNKEKSEAEEKLQKQHLKNQTNIALDILKYVE